MSFPILKKAELPEETVVLANRLISKCGPTWPGPRSDRFVFPSGDEISLEDFCSEVIRRAENAKAMYEFYFGATPVQLRPEFLAPNEVQLMTAADYLDLAKATIAQRGTENGYDKDEERSAPRIAALFESLTGRHLSEADVLKVLICLKLVRNENKPRQDNVVDLIGYAALLGETQAKNALHQRVGPSILNKE